MSKASILIFFLTVVAQLRGDGGNGQTRWGRYGIGPRTMSKVGTGPRPLLSAPSKHLAPQEEVTLQNIPSPGFRSMGPILTHPGLDRDVMIRRNAEFENLISKMRNSVSNLNEISDPFQSPTEPKKRVSIPIGGSPSKTLSPSPSRRYSDPPSSPSPYSSSYTYPSPSPPESQVKLTSPWLKNLGSISVPPSPTPPPSAPSPPPTPPATPSPPSTLHQPSPALSGIIKRLSSIPRTSSFDSAPPASCASSEANANPSINQYRRPLSFGKGNTLPSEVNVEPNILEPYPSPKPSTDSKPPSNSGSPPSSSSSPPSSSSSPPSISSSPWPNSGRFSNSGNKSTGQYNGSSNTKRYGGSTVVSDKLPDDTGTIQIKISGRQIDDDRMSQMVKEAENAITSVFYYPMHESFKRGSISFSKVPQPRVIDVDL